MLPRDAVQDAVQDATAPYVVRAEIAYALHAEYLSKSSVSWLDETPNILYDPQDAWGWYGQSRVYMPADQFQPGREGTANVALFFNFLTVAPAVNAGRCSEESPDYCDTVVSQTDMFDLRIETVDNLEGVLESYYTPNSQGTLASPDYDVLYLTLTGAERRRMAETTTPIDIDQQKAIRDDLSAILAVEAERVFVIPEEFAAAAGYKVVAIVPRQANVDYNSPDYADILAYYAAAFEDKTVGASSITDWVVSFKDLLPALTDVKFPEITNPATTVDCYDKLFMNTVGCIQIEGTDGTDGISAGIWILIIVVAVLVLVVFSIVVLPGKAMESVRSKIGIGHLCDACSAKSEDIESGGDK